MRTALACVALVGASMPCLAQAPAGSEFRVNTATTGSQFFPFPAALDDGFVVTWMSDGGGTNDDVFGQVVDRRGARVGAEFRINAYTTNRQAFTDVARQPGGRFVVAWESAGFDGFYSGVAVRLFQGPGAPVSGDLQANTYTTSNQTMPSIATDAGGNFVVVWNSFGQDGDSWGVFGQRFLASGARRGVEFRVNTTTAGVQFAGYGGAVAMDASGRFVVVWDSGAGHVDAQRYAADGAPLGGEFQVDLSAGPHGDASIAAAPSGEFVVTWVAGPFGPPRRVLARRFAADGTPLGSEFQANATPLANFYRPMVSVDAAGNAAIAWSSNNATAPTNAQLRRFLADGTPRGGEVALSAAPNSFSPGVAADASGNLLAAWAAETPDMDVWARRFGGLTPRPMAVDTSGNGVLEPGETVDVRPSWRNDNGAALTFGGTLAALIGPAGATYATTDGTGDYGTVADAATGACTDCYGVAVSAPPARPATHWDAEALETITPDALGQVKRWRLHVGDSFTDLPRTSPFYRFVETLLHNDVTAGCTAATYCPVAATTRAQMSVFVLVAKEGALYAPPACATPQFNDVPASSPFCPWIEELARRGVVAGCGAGRFCPDDGVTREQMAVFVLRTLDPALAPPACGVPMFADVPTASPFCRWVEELARRGVVTGCGGGSYCPALAVSREQMGVFLTVTFGLALYGP